VIFTHQHRLLVSPSLYPLGSTLQKIAGFSLISTMLWLWRTGFPELPSAVLVTVDNDDNDDDNDDDDDDDDDDDNQPVWPTWAVDALFRGRDVFT
jgi:hypothetical protein